MTTPQLPDYLRDDAPLLNDRATQGLGALLPPHISIRGNTFTLVDAAGNKRPHGAVLEGLIADISDHVCKQYFADSNWTPDSNDPPACWSANGVAPSRDAIAPPMLQDGSRQVRTCVECPKNVRGSAVSKLSGAAIKACRDEVWVGFVLPQYLDMIFQLKVTPGSFDNWRKYIEWTKTVGDVSKLLTRVAFQPEVNGVLVFSSGAYIDAATYAVRKKALASKATDAIVGRNDVPRQALEAPATQVLSYDQVARAQELQPAPGPAIPPQVQQPAMSPIQPASQPEPQRRKRRTQAEIAADNAQNQQTLPLQPASAPFRPAPTPGGASFGIATQPPGPGAELAQTIDDVFGKPAGGGFGS